MTDMAVCGCDTASKGEGDFICSAEMACAFEVNRADGFHTTDSYDTIH
jgi:hypothetical protein